MEAVIETLKTYVGQADEATRRALSGTLRDLAVTLESPNDTLQRVIYQPLELLVAKFAVDINLFKVMAENDRPETVNELATQTNADPLFLERILRYLAAFCFVRETGQGTYQATKVTKTFASPGAGEGISFHSMFYNPIIAAAPKYFEETKHRNPMNVMDSPFQKAFNTDMHPFPWLHTHTEYLNQFVPLMNAIHDGRPPWFTVVDLKQEFQGTTPKSPLFVDVGGGMGAQCAAVKDIAEGIPGRIINQDLKETLDHVPPCEGVENMVHDFFTPQPIKGAKIYYLRNILHDYPDDRCVELLGHLITAMDTKSVIFINELVLPNTGAHRLAVQQDIAMMITLTATERTEAQWRTLLGRAGLRIKAIRVHGTFMPDAIIEAVPEAAANGH